MTQHEAVNDAVAGDLMRKATKAVAQGRRSRPCPHRSDRHDADGLAPGDIIRLIGKRTTVAKAMPAYPKDRGKGHRADRWPARHNAGPGWANGCDCSAPSTVPPRRSDWHHSRRWVTRAKAAKIVMSAVFSKDWYSRG